MFFLSPSQGCTDHTDEALHVLQRKTSYRNLVATPCQTRPDKDERCAGQVSRIENVKLWESIEWFCAWEWLCTTALFIEPLATFPHNWFCKKLPFQSLVLSLQAPASTFIWKKQLLGKYGKGARYTRTRMMHMPGHYRLRDSRVDSEQKLDSLTMFGLCFCSPER